MANPSAQETGRSPLRQNLGEDRETLITLGAPAGPDLSVSLEIAGVYAGAEGGGTFDEKNG